MTLIASVHHAEIVGFCIDVHAELGKFSDNPMVDRFFEEGHLDCVLKIRGQPIWEVLIVRCTEPIIPAIMIESVKIVVLGTNEELMAVGVEYDETRSHFYAEVEDIYSGCRYWLLEQLTGPEVDM